MRVGGVSRMPVSLSGPAWMGGTATADDQRAGRDSTALTAATDVERHAVCDPDVCRREDTCTLHIGRMITRYCWVSHRCSAGMAPVHVHSGDDYPDCDVSYGWHLLAYFGALYLPRVTSAVSCRTFRTMPNLRGCFCLSVTGCFGLVAPYPPRQATKRILEELGFGDCDCRSEKS